MAGKIKKTLINTAGLLGIKINQNFRKAAIAKRMAEAILVFPTLLLEQLPLQELLKLQQMVHAKEHAVPANQSHVMDCIDQIGATDSRFNGGQTQDLIYPDLAAALLPTIDEFVEKARADEPKYRREQLMPGLLNLYGILNFKEIEESGTRLSMPTLLTLAAMKAFALGRKAKGKDYVDLFFILRDNYSIIEISNQAQNIFAQLFSEKLFREQLAFHKDIDYTEQVGFMGKPVSDEEIK